MRSPGRQVTIAAKPEALTIDPAQSAVIVVDMQNDFGAEGGMFALRGIDISRIRAVVAPTSRVLAAARLAGVTVVYLKMAFRPDLSDAGAPDAPNWLKHLPLRPGESATAPDGTPSRILIRAVLKSRSIRNLIFTGCTTSVCVESTIRDAMFRDYNCLLLADCTAEPIGDRLPRSNHDASLLVIQAQFGWVSESAEFITALEGQLQPVPA